MKRMLLTAVLAMASVAAPSFAQTPASSLGSVTLTRGVMADGKRLNAGTYQVRLTDESLKPAVGQSPDAERYVEFLQNGRVVGREVATVVPSGEVAGIAKWRQPSANGVSVELLKGNDYLRVWISRAGTHYLINMPTAS